MAPTLAKSYRKDQDTLIEQLLTLIVVIVSSPSYIAAACTSVSAYICPPLQIVHLRDVPLPYRIRSELKIVVHYWPQLLTPGTLHVLAVAIVTE